MAKESIWSLQIYVKYGEVMLIKHLSMKKGHKKVPRGTSRDLWATDYQFLIFCASGWA